jgi:hypothetical protein
MRKREWKTHDILQNRQTRRRDLTQIGPNKQRTLRNRPQSKMRPLFRRRHHPIPHLQHTKVTEASWSSIGIEILVAGSDIRNTQPGIPDVARDAPGVASGETPGPGGVSTPVAKGVVDWAAGCEKGVAHGGVAGLRVAGGGVAL